MQSWAKAHDIVTWSEDFGSMAQLPALLRRLIHSTAETLDAINFPAGKDVVRPGFDGVVNATGLRWIPDGKSYWEVSTRDDALIKANKDHDKRVEQTLKIDRQKTTYVCVTTRRWPDRKKCRQEWEEEKKKTGGWAAVRVIDAGTIEEWLEIAPAVNVWFARALGLIGSADGFLDLNYQWINRTSGVGEPTLPAEFFLSKRDDQRDQIRKFFLGNDSELFMEADDKGDCVDLLASVFHELSEIETSVVGSKALVVETQQTFRQLVRIGRPLILIQGIHLELDPEDVAEAVRNGQRLIHCNRKSGQPNPTAIQVSRRTCHDIEVALKAANYHPDKARTLSIDSNGRVPVLKRLLRSGGVKPAWATSASTELLPALLIGSWLDSNNADRTIVSLLSDSDYGVLTGKLQKLRTLDEPPMELGKTHWRGGPDEYWKWQSRAEAWSLLSPLLRAQDFEQFASAAQIVLGDENPRYHLPAKERVYSNITGHKLEVSSEIRKGVAEGLALLGGRADQTSDPAKSKMTAAIAVRRILHNASWRLWASLDSVLPLLAEASPEEFLDATENDLSQSEGSLVHLFKESEGSLLIDSTPHAGLLWALETLAWHADYFNRAVLALSHLASLDPGGQTCNRPINSLGEIFAAWTVNTTVGNERRLEALELIERQFPEIGYSLLRITMPSSHGFSMGCHKPQWRPWLTNYEQRVFVTEYTSYVEAIFEKLIEVSTRTPRRHRKLLSYYDHNRTEKHHARIRKIIEMNDTREWHISDQEKMSTAIRRLINEHRFFKDSDWALPESALAPLEKIREQYEPDDLHYRHRWLFESNRIDFDWMGSEEMDHQEREKVIEEMRMSVLKDIYEQGGTQGAIAFSEMTSKQHYVGFLLGELDYERARTQILPEAISSPEADKFSLGFLAGTMAADPWGWTQKTAIETWSAQARARLASNLKFESRTWDWVKNQSPEVEDHYWQMIDAWSGELDQGQLERALKELHKRKRFGTVLGMLKTALYKKQDCCPDLVFKTLEGLLDHQDQLKDTHIVQRLFTYLQDIEKIDLIRLGQIEWAYIRALDPHSGGIPKTLHHNLANDPNFLVEVLSLVYKDKNAPKKNIDNISENEQTQIELARSLLDGWKTCPCILASGELDEQALGAYVEQVQELSTRVGRRDIAMYILGAKFAYAPANNGIWPPLAINEVLQTTPGEDMLQGLNTAIRNKRGIHTWTAGVEEMDLANDFKEKATKVDTKWPKVAATLRDIAQSYEDQAKRAATVNPYAD